MASLAGQINDEEEIENLLRTKRPTPEKNVLDTNPLKQTINASPLSPQNAQDSNMKVSKLKVKKSRKRSISKLQNSSTLSEHIDASKRPKIEACSECGIPLAEAKTFEAPEECDEEIALVSDDLILNRADDDNKELYQGKLKTILVYQSVANARFYCREGHLCSIDSGIMERDKLIFLSGYVKPHMSLDTSLTGGAQMDKSNPVFEWYISGLGHEEVFIYVSTACGIYRIISVASDYEPFIKNALNMTVYTNHFIRSLVANDDISLDEVISNFKPSGCMSYLLDIPTKQDFLASAPFMYEQIKEYMEEPNEDGSNDTELLQLESFVEFCDLSNLNEAVVQNKKKVKKSKGRIVKTKLASTKAATTPLVRDVFTHLFDNQMVENSDMPSTSAQPMQETFSAIFAKLMESGKNGKRSYTCSDVQLSEDGTEVLSWCKIKENNQNKEWELKPGVFVGFVVPAKKDEAGESKFGQIQYLVKSKGEIQVHIQIFKKDCILYELADRGEVFGYPKCLQVPITCVSCLLPICHKKLFDKMEMKNNNAQFYYQMQHVPEDGTFVALPKIEDVDIQTQALCLCCIKVNEEKMKTMVQLKGKYFLFNGETYSRGTSIFVNCIPMIPPEIEDLGLETDFTSDSKVYTEAFRKESTRIKDESTKPMPLQVCQIVGFVKSKKQEMVMSPQALELNVRLFRRPDHTSKEDFKSPSPHKLFYTNELIKIRAADILGIAHVCYVENISANRGLANWLVGGENRFYFSERQNYKEKTFTEVPVDAKTVTGAIDPETGFNVFPPDYPVLHKRLNSLDLFAGCGGLSRGLHDSGLCKVKWACEFDQDAAVAFKKNFPNSTVFTEDINQWFSDILEEKETNSAGQHFPQRGEVDMICGGPPCQGFSSMNRFGAREVATFKNSLVTTYFSLVDFYKPKYFLFENVKNFSTNSSNGYLKAALACTLKIGYQVRFGILQAGCYGVPQSRHRSIIIGALPGYELPKFPKMTHAFSMSTNVLTVGKVTINSGITFGDLKEKAAPFREVNVYDAISDLPDVESGKQILAVEYPEDPASVYQLVLRRSSKALRDHIARPIAPLDYARISLIPYGGDWRDLPNLSIKLSDGTYTETLKYISKNGKSAVCPCHFEIDKSGKKSAACVKPPGRNTLIPWCLPHTASRHAQWRGLYGRLNLQKQFSTTTTYPEPMGKQGRVLHPYYNRCITVREAARSQGFPDDTYFCGDFSAKYRQVGNAVPPPLAEKLGHMILKSYIQSSRP